MVTYVEDGTFNRVVNIKERMNFIEISMTLGVKNKREIYVRTPRQLSIRKRKLYL